MNDLDHVIHVNRIDSICTTYTCNSLQELKDVLVNNYDFDPSWFSVHNKLEIHLPISIDPYTDFYKLEHPNPVKSSIGFFTIERILGNFDPKALGKVGIGKLLEVTGYTLKVYLSPELVREYVKSIKDFYKHTKKSRYPSIEVDGIQGKIKVILSSHIEDLILTLIKAVCHEGWENRHYKFYTFRLQDLYRFLGDSKDSKLETDLYSRFDECKTYTIMEPKHIGC